MTETKTVSEQKVSEHGKSRKGKVTPKIKMGVQDKSLGDSELEILSTETEAEFTVLLKDL